ncbi:histidine kinase [Paenibacillus naphthalenovorans]|uniref:histidine kinase n=1 Tax=Paenibacillus naphthalenovorans TaxID=162209 RepID=UPI0009437624|nr:histidine kinase [Paenibacillus naphthalenovorans]
MHQGRLKIIIGSVSGAGKTYHMLREGQLLKQQGIDVVICAVTTLQRTETAELLQGFERIASIKWGKDGKEKEDLDLDALIERNPDVVLVDGLAHHNRKDARFPTRLDDIKFLLGHGISVITTINVYELGGFAEIAKKLTGIDVEETVPADTLELADEVRLIDVTPETILARLAEGAIQADESKKWFKRGNLAILRELALRLVAEDVNASLEEYREELGMVGPSGATERILVSTQYHWNGSLYVRRGQQVAKRLNGDLFVVTFIDPKKKLSKEAATFKRSMIKLVEKVGGQFEELPLRSRRRLPSDLVRYATKYGVTRIVMGHSKQSRWQEFWQGSVINGLLGKIKNIDVFFMTDRAEHEGRRILPAKMGGTGDRTSYKRPSMQEVESRIASIKRGTFKVYIGAAPGVGKTYTMLLEGNDLKKKGFDVVIGLLETHGRKETLAQVGNLEIIPRKTIHYKGARLEEMDTDAIIRRAPDIVLVDELAHTNVPGSQNRKRYEDVLRLLDAGISVISTVNVQHLESLNDAVEQITGIRVRETVPDRILQLADEVQLIDVTPQTLQQRMKEGKIYDLDKVDQALSHFFKTGNLIALRELALREIADDVDERLESWERKSSLRGPWRRQEVIYVCVNVTPHAERLIRRGFRIAYRLKAVWYVTFVRPEGMEMTKEIAERIETLRKLTERLGGTFEIQTAANYKEIHRIIVQKANEYNTTQLIVGQSKVSFWEEIYKGSLIKSLLRTARHMDVLVVSDYEAGK